MKILITGDLVVLKPYNAKDNIDPYLINLFSKSDYNIVNLEAPITTSQNKIIKTGPHLKANRDSTLEVFKILNIHIATLANNHIKDYDEQGVLDTINFCQNNNIKTIGAGINIEDAARIQILQTPEGSIAIINIAENEWASADENSAGSNGMSYIKDIQKIQQAKQTYDYIFMIIHGGHEYYKLPSPRIQQQYRFYIEQGADLIVSHHTHCISGYEIYRGKPIFYGLGNFLFTKKSTYRDWYTGLILQIELNNKKLTTQLLPIQQDEETFQLKKHEDTLEINAKIERYNQIIKNESNLKKNWDNYVLEKTNMYVNYWSISSFIKNRYLKKIIRKIMPKLGIKNSHKLFLNLTRCEAHNDLSKEIFKKIISK